MYEYLRGVVTETRPTSIVVECAGLGFALIVPAGTHFERGSEHQVFVHQVVREDSHTLYGFGDRAARDLFRTLLKVKQVGPAMAIGILSGMDREEFVACVRNKDAARLTKVKGVGKKTAEQILLDLEDRFGPGSAAEEAAGASASGLPPLDDAVAALVSIGFTEKEAKKAAEKAAKEVGADDLDALLRAALRG